MKLLSICIPCNKRVKYLRNTLRSIYVDNSDVSLDEFEVVVSDNDPEMECSVLVTEFKGCNLKYVTTRCEGFMNSYNVLTYGGGDYLLLHNSQEMFRKGSLRYIINLLKMNRECYFLFTSCFLLNGENKKYLSFDDFMYGASYWTSWSNAFGIWRKDFMKIKNNVTLNQFFPHTSLLLTQVNHKRYIVCDYPLFDTQFVSGRSGHNKFHAFSYEYPALIDHAYKSNYISEKTKKRIMYGVLHEYLPLLYFNVKITKRESWSSLGFEKEIKIYFPKGSFYLVQALSLLSPFKIIWRRIKRQILR